ncbi:MAG: uracil-DNA glycosylase [Desulfitobacteriaceae bacterium]|nr:uracil-DNA glycosylase [Desulfitobacteriaceae bacterium]MDD4753633.1 uracil-DNA glycosylase [Desulfitobacteriaceae bacterium]
MDLGELENKLQNCTSCGLCRTRTNMVFGKGSRNAQVMFVGEGPGEQEDLQGKPFVGKAGQLLDRIIAASELPPEHIYICNVMKCRPPGNRFPNEEEVDACKPFLREQIRIIRPKIIVCLGALATKTIVRPDARITRDRGRWVQKGSFQIMPTFHPAALLRDPDKKRPVWEDMKQVRERYKSF